MNHESSFRAISYCECVCVCLFVCCLFVSLTLPFQLQNLRGSTLVQTTMLVSLLFLPGSTRQLWSHPGLFLGLQDTSISTCDGTPALMEPASPGNAQAEDCRRGTIDSSCQASSSRHASTIIMPWLSLASGHGGCGKHSGNATTQQPAPY